MQFKDKSPPQSSNLNPIEMIWSDLKKNLRSKILSEKLDLVGAIYDY